MKHPIYILSELRMLTLLKWEDTVPATMKTNVVHAGCEPSDLVKVTQMYSQILRNLFDR